MKNMNRKKNRKIMVAVILGIVLLSGIAVAEVGHISRGPGITLSSIAIDDSAGGTDNTAVYNISAYLDPEVGVSEHVELSIDPSSPNWAYTFSETEFDMVPGDTKNVTLSMELPDGTTAGNYFIKVNGNASVLGIPGLPPETAFTQCFVNVSATVVMSAAAVPTLMPTGIIALAGLLAVVAVGRIRRKK